MDREKLRKYLMSEAEKPFQGWDSSYSGGRVISKFLPWDYRAAIHSYLNPEDKLLDMGTGGGATLLTLGHSPERTVVAERNALYLALFKERLAPMGITVKPVSDDTLPFEDETFDIIINQHETFLPKEVYRILKKGGIFITQQVGGSNNLHLRQCMLDGLEPMHPEHDLDHCVASLKEAGFAIFHEDEVFLPVIFNDLGVLVNYAANVPWEFPGFSVDACFDNLLQLDDMIRERGYIEGTEHRFIVICKKLNK